MCHRATKPMHHNYWSPSSRAPELQLVEPTRLEPVLRKQRSRHDEKPTAKRSPRSPQIEKACGSDGSVCLQCGRPRFDSWVGKIPRRRKWQPTPALLPGKSHGQRSLIGYSPWGHKESGTTERLHFHFVHSNKDPAQPKIKIDFKK